MILTKVQRLLGIRKKYVTGALFLLGGAALFFIAGGEAMAQGKNLAATCSDYVGLTNRIATCVRESLVNVTGEYFTEFYPLVQYAIAAFLTLGIAVYGVLAAAGMIEKIGRDSMMLLLKIACIGYFTMSADVMYGWALNAMDGLGAEIVDYTPGAGKATSEVNFDNLTCIKQMKEATADMPYSPPWLAMDCLVDSVIGIKMPLGTGPSTAGKEPFNKKLNPDDKGLARGMLYIFFAAGSTSVVGFLLAAVGVLMVYGLIFLIINALFTYLAGYLGVAFMMIFAPIFIPLVLFRTTKIYFDKWLKLVISFTLQPIIILVFLMFSMAAIDLAIFSGEYSLMYRIAGEASRQNGFSLNRYLIDNNVVVKKPKVLAKVPANRGSVAVTCKGFNTTFANACDSVCTASNMAADANIRQVCEQAYSIQVQMDTMNWNQLAAIRSPAVVPEPGVVTKAQQHLREMLAAAVFCALVMFVMNALLAVVPKIANDLIGDLHQSPNLYARGGGQDVVQGISGTVGGVGQQMRDMVSGRR